MGEEKDKSSPILAPTYQTVLINALNTAVTRMMNNDQFGAFQSFEVLHSVLKPKMQEFISKPWKKFLADKRKIQGNGDMLHRQLMHLRTASYSFLRKNNPVIMQHFIRTLDFFGYLTRDWKPLVDSDFKKIEGENGEEGETEN